MARAGLRFTIIGLAATGLLMGCVEGGGKAGSGDGSAVAAAPGKKKGGSQDVEAPEIFQTTDSALWDGRPSLGGIWVASPEVTTPERVLIFNPATGKSITGALFKRERENPGPKLQLSSDAAEALGILAGAPTEIRVTALRKVEEEAPAEEAAVAAAPPTDPAAAPEGTDATKKGGDEAAAIASAALAAVDADKPADPAAAPVDPDDPAAVAAAAAGAAAAVVDEKPKRKTWKERRAEAKAAREAKKRAAAEAAAAASAAEADAAMAAGEVPAATADSAAVAPIESAPLDARNPEAVAAKPEAKSKRKTVGDAPAPAAEAPAEAAGNAAPVAASGPVRPIQVASFSKEDNAKRAAEALAKIGVTATPQKSEKGGKAVWGVIVQGDEAMLKKIKDAGFADAYFLK